ERDGARVRVRAPQPAACPRAGPDPAGPAWPRAGPPGAPRPGTRRAAPVPVHADGEPPAGGHPPRVGGYLWRVRITRMGVRRDGPARCRVPATTSLLPSVRPAPHLPARAGRWGGRRGPGGRRRVDRAAPLAAAPAAQAPLAPR